MWHLAVESSGTAGSIAIARLDPDTPFLPCEVGELSPDAGSVRTLAPAIASLLDRHSIQARDIGLISVTAGPGSFTGLRVGIATVQALSLAWDIPIAPVDTLAAIALRFARATEVSTEGFLCPAGGRLVTILNAFRKQVFAAAWYCEQGDIHRASDSQVLDIATWLESPWEALSPKTAPLSNSKDLLWLSGPGLAVARPEALEFRAAPADLHAAKAAEVGELGRRLFLTGQTVSAERLRPDYIRASAAEERRKSG